MQERKYILFDLDGTLSDSGPGIMASVSHALKHFGIEGDPKILRTFIGPPLHESFPLHFGFDEEKTAEAIRIYRQHFHDHGFFQNEVYPGIPELLEDLLKAGKTIAVATARATVYAPRLWTTSARQIFRQGTGYRCLPRWQRTDKAEVIAAVLERLGGGPLT